MGGNRVGGSTPRQPVEVNPTPRTAPRRSGETVPPVIDEARARYVTGARHVEAAFPVAAGARSSGLSKGETLAMTVLLRAAKLMFSDPNSGGSDPDSGVA